jgi:peptidoglycan/xylan/chitin deacetylase (PgdA/CDA1 family)
MERLDSPQPVRPRIPAAVRAEAITWQLPPTTTTTTSTTTSTTTTTTIRKPVVTAARSALPVSLTFDDGPNETFTPQVLDLLAAHGVTATFFVLGSAVEQFPDLARRIVAEGHRLANHSWDHADLTAIGPDALAEQIDKTTAAITAVTGTTPRCLRPPFGRTNDAVQAAARARGLAIAKWSKDTRDYERPGVQYIVRHALEGAVSGGVILFHDSGPDMSQTVAALPAIIKGIQARGLRIAPIC